ncbi:protein lev-9 [Trichonephila inaurata madagascariensis]|uniref:Protein lev-9 n=1 Tax=Trichonephila inaurata madagascariensis TaxID=2747483 RepID=A0A8X6XBH2_9ARAC|nr:protein lev-9 [Trichonephila inaurata madagascariensis]
MECSKFERLCVELEILEKKKCDLSSQHKWSALNDLEKEDMINFNAWNSIPASYDQLKNPSFVVLSLFAGSTQNEETESTSDEPAIGRTGFVNTTKGSVMEAVQPLSIAVHSQTVSEDLKSALNVSNTFPSCETNFQITSKYKQLPGGIIGVEKGKSLSIICYSNGIEKYPLWAGPKDINRVTYSSDWEPYSSQYINQLIITNINQQHNGLYQCYLPGFNPSDIFIQVLNPEAAKCPKLEDDDLHIEYDNEQFVHSSAVFSCKGPNQKLIGSRILTCLPNGQWSGVKPLCEKLCPEIPETDGMAISYTANQNKGSIATFHCFSPRVRTGVSHTTLPTCLVDSLFRIAPENEVAAVSSENVPFSSTVTLKCEGGLKLIGPDKAKCRNNGAREVSKVQCFSGYNRPLDIQDSDLIIEPNKDFYSLGETVAMSCPAGQILSSETVYLFCLVTG